MRHVLRIFNAQILIGLGIGLVVGVATGTPPLPVIDKDEANPIRGSMRVWFSARGGCTEAAIAAIDVAEKSIHVRAHGFTSSHIAQALCAAAHRGVNVVVLADKFALLDQHTALPQLVQAKAQVYIDDPHHISSPEVIVIDGKLVLAGSFNGAPKVEVGNAENLLIIDSLDLAVTYLTDWEEHRRHSKPLEWNLDMFGWILSPMPDPKHRDLTQVVHLVQEAFKFEAWNWAWWNTLGKVQYRAGDWKPALAALKKSIELGKDGDGFDWFFLAMACWQVGSEDEARRWYYQAVLWADKNGSGDGELRRLRIEATKLLGAKEKPNSETKFSPKPGGDY